MPTPKYDPPKIYRFGGAGNDWCFVYLPRGYDPERAEPYPFVICNHGNGWTMDGTPQKANWTKRTMYLPADDPDLLKAPDQYNACANPAAWYRNPTVDAFLDAGYIVCGAQNHADQLYGNEDCRSACAAFYNHMVNTYHVRPRCHMIGASNGAMTTLNTVFLLGQRVESVILQYPLTCLEAQYMAYPPHREAIERTHGVTARQITEGIFRKERREFDPLYANVENGIKTGYFPRTMILYSTTDTVVPCESNGLLLADLLQKSGKTVRLIQADTDGKTHEHGDPAHFRPEEFVRWMQGEADA